MSKIHELHEHERTATGPGTNGGPMHVFVTGGAGLIGSAVVSELLANGHTVLALARSERSASAIEQAGAEPLRGSMADVDVVRAGAGRCDGVIHLAFDFSSAEAIEQSVAEDVAVLGALGEDYLGSDRPIVAVSGTPWVPGKLATEQDPLPTDGIVGGRARAVNALLELSSQGVRSSAVRVARTAHDEGRGGFAGLLVDQARRIGVSGYPGDGTQRWPAVHVRDAAVLFRLALESAPAGSSWHAVADEGDRVGDIAGVIGRRLGVPVQSLPTEDFGPFGEIFALDQPASSTHTRRALGWEPEHPSLLEDLELLQP